MDSVALKKLAKTLNMSEIKSIDPSANINDFKPPFYRFQENGKGKKIRYPVSNLFIKYSINDIIEISYNEGFVYESSFNTHGLLKYYVQKLTSFSGEELMKEEPICRNGFIISASNDNINLKMIENILKEENNRLYIFLTNERRWKIV